VNASSIATALLVVVWQPVQVLPAQPITSGSDCALAGDTSATSNMKTAQRHPATSSRSIELADFIIAPPDIRSWLRGDRSKAHRRA
jgi:hypothetical protein